MINIINGLLSIKIVNDLINLIYPNINYRHTKADRKPTTLFKAYTPKELINYNGKNNKSIYIAVNGNVFDVTKGKNFYGPS